MTAPIRIGLARDGSDRKAPRTADRTRGAGARPGVVFDVDAASVAEVADELGVDTASSPEELMAAPSTDAVAICTSTDKHVELVVAASKTGKPLFLEKPVSLDLAEVDRALAAVERPDAPSRSASTAGSIPHTASVRDAIAVRRGRRVAPRAHHEPRPEPSATRLRPLSGGIFLDMTVHDFDMARFVTGSEVDEVYARGECGSIPRSAKPATSTRPS